MTYLLTVLSAVHFLLLLFTNMFLLFSHYVGLLIEAKIHNVDNSQDRGGRVIVSN